MSISYCLEKFRTGIESTNSFILMAYQPDVIIEDYKIEFIVESSFLKMFIYWEEFLESVFAFYLLGEKSIEDKEIKRHVIPKDIKHAHEILIGSQSYVDWASQEKVLKLAKIYLEGGEPLNTNLLSISTELNDLRTIRNAAAHISSSTQKNLNAVASRVLKKQVQSITVTNLVMSMHPDDKNKTFLQYYQNILDIVAENIAKGQI